MAEQITIARPYAKALFDLASKEQSDQEWDSILKLLAEATTNSAVRAIIDNPEATSQQLEDLFNDIAQDRLKANAELRQQCANLLSLLIANHRLTLLPEIAYCYQELLAKKKELLEVTVISAHHLDKDQQEKMQQVLADRFKSNITIDFQVDNKLIGGAIIRSGSWVMDDSIKGKLTRFYDSLCS